jgi:hypothetical protein
MKDIISYLGTNHDIVSAVTAVAALVVSTISIILAICNMAVQRTHNRKSVLPIAHVGVGDYEERIFVSLRNNGVGPMLVDEVVVTRCGANNDVKSSVIDFMPDLPGEMCWKNFVANLSGSALPADKELELLVLEGDPIDPEFIEAKEQVRIALSQLRIEVKYRNVYGERMPPTVRNLEWFAR